MNVHAIRLLFLTHRYLGIGLGLLMVVWCLSGIVMMYVPYPALTNAERLLGLPEIDAAACCVLDGNAFPATDTAIRNFELEMTGGTPILSMTPTNGRPYRFDLGAGRLYPGVTEDGARAVARGFARGVGSDAEPTFLQEILRDQWTAGQFRADRPLYLFAINDPAGTELYISSTTGRAVQVTTARARFWNWLGAVPHWLYFTRLRENPQLWSQIVIWTSALGGVLSVLGIIIGVRQVRRRGSNGRLASPYRGMWLWHHVPGLAFGLFTLTWVFSGLLSMTPWGLLAGSDPTVALTRLYGGPLDWARIRAGLPAILANLPAGTVSVQSAPFGDELHVLATLADGTAIRLDAEGAIAPLSEPDYAAAAARLGASPMPAAWSLLNAEDAYYYGRSGAPPPLPVLRVITEGEGAARFYLDPASARLLRYADADARTHRWLFSGLHSLDFSRAFRSRPFWDVLMIALLLGATLVCATGTWLGIKRVCGRSRGQGFLVAPPKPQTRAQKSAQLP